MRIWAEIWNGAQTEMFGTVDLAGVSIVRNLDKAGKIVLDVAAMDPQAITLMRGFRWAYVFTDYPRRQRIGTGILMSHNISISSGQKTVSWTCIDALVDLQRANTLTARIYDNQPMRTVIRDLVELAGWTVKFDQVAGNTSYRFDGATVLEAIMTLSKLHGYHFRQGTGRQIVFGELGDASDVRLIDSARVGWELYSNRQVALIEQMTVQEDWTQVINAIQPFSGPIDGALTLRRSNKIVPYPIQTRTGPNGETLYYLQDDEAQAEHGVEILAVEGPKDLVFPVSSENTSLINASNVLYDWAATQLMRRSAPQRNYTATVAKLDVAESLVGRMVRLTYKGEARTHNQQNRLVNEDEDFWVVQQTDRYSLSGVSTNLDLSSNSEPPRKPEQMIAQVLKRGNKLAAQMNVSQRNFKETLTYAGYGDSQTLDFEVNDATIDVTACRVKITRANANTGPDRLRLLVDGVEVPGGYFLEGPAAGLTVTVDIADVIVGLETVRGEHVLTIQALYGTGDLVVNMALYEAIVGLN